MSRSYGTSDRVWHGNPRPVAARRIDMGSTRHHTIRALGAVAAIALGAGGLLGRGTDDASDGHGRGRASGGRRSVRGAADGGRRRRTRRPSRSPPPARRSPRTRLAPTPRPTPAVGGLILPDDAAAGDRGQRPAAGRGRPPGRRPGPHRGRRRRWSGGVGEHRLPRRRRRRRAVTTSRRRRTEEAYASLTLLVPPESLGDGRRPPRGAGRAGPLRPAGRGRHRSAGRPRHPHRQRPRQRRALPRAARPGDEPPGPRLPRERADPP